MGKYRLIRLNEVRYTDDEYTLELWLDEGFVLEPAFDKDSEAAAAKPKKKATKAAEEQP